MVNSRFQCLFPNILHVAFTLMVHMIFKQCPKAKWPTLKEKRNRECHFDKPKIMSRREMRWPLKYREESEKDSICGVDPGGKPQTLRERPPHPPPCPLPCVFFLVKQRKERKLRK